MVKISGGSQYLAYGKSHYERNKAIYIAAAAARRLKTRQYVRAIKEQGQCVDCGIKDWRVLEFDHKVDCTKLFDVSKAAEKGFSINKIDAEIAKCELRCANCHRIVTFERAGIV